VNTHPVEGDLAILKAKSPLSFLTRRKSAPADPAPDDWDAQDEAPRFEAQPEPGHGTTRDSIGPLLRQTRESFGYDLQRISQALRIRYLYLDAIEKGNFDRLPGPAYAVGFIRSYSDFLGLDSEKILEFYKRDAEVPLGDSSFHFPEPVSESKVPGVAIISLCVILAVVGYGSWYYASQPGSDVADIIPEVPDRLKVLLEPEEAEVEQAIADATAEGKDSLPALPPSADAETGAATDDEVMASTGDGAEQTATPESASEAAPEVEAPETGGADAETSAPQGDGGQEGEIAASEEPSTGDPTTEDPTNEDLAAETLTGDATAPQAVVALEDDEISALIDQMVGGNEEAPSDAAAATTAPETMTSETVNADDAAPAGEVTALETEAPAPDRAAADNEPSNVETMPDTAASTGTDAAATAAVPEIPAVPSVESTEIATLAPDPQVYGDLEDEARVVLRAVEDCWVQVREESGNLLLSRVLRPGDTYRVPDKQNLTLLAGNAGGLEVLVDGQALPPLGPVGAVRRDIPLSVDALLGGTANLQ